MQKTPLKSTTGNLFVASVTNMRYGIRKSSLIVLQGIAVDGGRMATTARVLGKYCHK